MIYNASLYLAFNVTQIDEWTIYCFQLGIDQLYSSFCWPFSVCLLTLAVVGTHDSYLVNIYVIAWEFLHYGVAVNNAIPITGDYVPGQNL